MSEFHELFKAYRSASQWRIFRRVYSEASGSYKRGLILFSLLPIILLVSLLKTPNYLATIFPISIFVWGIAYNLACKKVFESMYMIFPDSIPFYGANSQYIRYLIFLELTKDARNSTNVRKAVAHINSILFTEDESVSTRFPLIGLLAAATMAVLSGFSGKLKPEVGFAILSVLSSLLFFTFAVAPSFPTRVAKLKEFKRFLLWAKAQCGGT